MLEGLEDVSWEKLTHAYGTATNVPRMLRAVAEGDPDAMEELFGSIWHQGTVYEATAHAVPFLIELLDCERADRTGLMHLLREIAHGSSYVSEHFELMRRSQRDAAELRGRMERELEWVAQAREAVVIGVPVYLRHLRDGRTENVRSSAAYVLGSCEVAHRS